MFALPSYVTLRVISIKLTNPLYSIFLSSMFSIFNVPAGRLIACESVERHTWTEPRTEHKSKEIARKEAREHKERSTLTRTCLSNSARSLQPAAWCMLL